MQLLKVLAGLGACAVLLTGCSSVSLDEDAKKGTLLSEQMGQQFGPDGQPINALDPFEDPANPLSQSVIYFGFDQFDVAPTYWPVLEAHARWLVAHPNTKIVVQGHTDERGGREYNLALGQKRSEAVKQRMQLLGVPASVIEAVSFGEESPEAYGHDEESWAKNRRVKIVYPNGH